MLFITLIILVGLVVLATIIYNTVEGDGFIAGLAYGLAFGALTGVAAIVIFIIACLLTPAGNYHKLSDHTVKRELTSLNVQQRGEINGNFYLGSGGSIHGESEPGYTYMYKAVDKNEQTYYKLATVPTEDSRVYESDTETPVVTTRTREYELRNTWLLPFPFETKVQHDYTFTVPTGSIVQNYQTN